MPRRFPSIAAVASAMAAIVPFVLAACKKPPPPPPPDPRALALASASAAAAAVKAARAAQGGELFTKYCALCHGADATGYIADHAPSLVSPTFITTVGDGFLARAIREGRPNTAMAAYAKTRGGPLTEDDVLAINLFLHAKGPPAIVLPNVPGTGDATRGEEVYNGNCVKCHGTHDVRGDAPHLANPIFLATASDAFIRYAVKNGRPPTPMPAFGATLGDEQIADVAAFIRSWTPPPPEPPKRELPIEVPVLPPYVINPHGPTPKFVLKEDRYVPADDVKKALDAKDRIIIIDARPGSAWLTGHIPGALPIPYYQAPSLDLLPKDGTWIVAYCACPHHASGAVVDELRKRGYPHTAVLDEGITVWEQRKYPVVPGTVPSASASASAAASAPPKP